MELDECKERITANLQRDIGVSTASKEDLEQLVGPEELTALHKAVRLVGNPRKCLVKIHETMGELLAQLEELLDDMGSGDEKLIEGGEGLSGDPERDLALSGVVLYKGETVRCSNSEWVFRVRIVQKSVSHSYICFVIESCLNLRSVGDSSTIDCTTVKRTDLISHGFQMFTTTCDSSTFKWLQMLFLNILEITDSLPFLSRTDRSYQQRLAQPASGSVRDPSPIVRSCKGNGGYSRATGIWYDDW